MSSNFTIFLLILVSGTSLVQQDAKPAAKPVTIEPVFADVATGREIISTKDDFVRRLSPFDRAARMKTEKEVSEEDYLSFVTNQIMPWNDDEIQKIQHAFDSLRSKMSGITIDIPKVITFVKTTGLEEAGTKYTRGTAIFLPEKSLKAPDSRLERTICHELFHVISRSNPQLRDRLYESIGYVKCNEIDHPVHLRNRRLTNPDAPANDHCILVKVDDLDCWAIPILYADVDNYSEKRGGEFLSYLKFDFLIVNRDADGNVTPVNEGDSVKLVDAKKIKNLTERIGDNTKYIIHPEEVIADNFMFLMMQDQNLPSPKILEGIRKILYRAN